MCIPGLFGGDGGSKELARQQQREADQARADAERKAAALRTGMSSIDSAFSAFDDAYFDNLSKSYLDYAKPQLDNQYKDQSDNITYALARGGNLNSSVKGDLFGKLDKQYALNLTGINSNASDVANNARRAVQSNRNDVVNQLNATYDTDAARTSALAAAKTLAVPQSFSPLANLFTNVSALAAQNKLMSDSTGGNMGARMFGGVSPSYVVN